MNSKALVNNKRQRTLIDSTPNTRSQAGRPLDSSKDEAILLAARELLLAQGPQALTMEAVAKKAGVSKATLYSRHKNSNALMAAIMRRRALLFTENIDAMPTSPSDLKSALLNFSKAILQFMASEENQQFMRALSAASSDKVDMQALYAEGPGATLASLEEWLHELAEQGYITCAQPRLSAEMLLGMLLRMDTVKVLHGLEFSYTSEDLQQYAQYTVDLFLQMHGVAS